MDEMLCITEFIKLQNYACGLEKNPVTLNIFFAPIWEKDDVKLKKICVLLVML